MENFKLNEIKIKNDDITLDLNTQLYLIWSRLASKDIINNINIEFIDIVKSSLISNNYYNKIKSMLCQSDNSLFKDLSDSYVRCTSKEMFLKTMVYNIPIGIETVQLNLRFRKDTLPKIIQALEGSELESELKTRFQEFL